MTQSRWESAAESVASTAIGFGVAYASTLVILPAFGFPVSGGQSFWITCWFTAISLVRGYCVRRLFERRRREPRPDGKVGGVYRGKQVWWRNHGDEP